MRHQNWNSPYSPRDLSTLRLVRIAFGFVITGLLTANLVALANLRSAEATQRLLLNNIMRSSELVARIARDVDQKRLAVDEHFVSTHPDEMDQLERQIQELDHDFAEAAAEYEPIATLEGESIEWQRLKREATALDGPIRNILQLSREGRDLDARRALDAMSVQFDDINHAADDLIEINRAAAADLAKKVMRVQHTSTVVLVVITVPGALFAVITAMAVTRILRRRDALLTNAWGQLETRNRELDAFAGRVAHDLRGPLTAIDLSAHRMASQLQGESSALGILRRAAGQMNQLIADLLSLSRVGGDAALGAANIGEAATLFEQDLRPGVTGVGGTLKVDVEAVEVRCNMGLLRQLLWNLGENAVKYRRSDVALHVEVRGRLDSGSYELRFSDNGPGMPPDEARQAFEPFFRGEGVRDTPGTGLGLSIVKRIVDACGGSIVLQTSPSRGTTFHITLVPVR